MKRSIFRQLMSFAMIMVFAPALYAGEGHGAVGTMSGILIKLNHYPGAEEKAKLQEIANNPDSSDGVKTIALAIHDMQHKVSAEDQAKLQAIVASDSADEDVKKLAEILMGIHHKPSDDAVAELKSLKG